MRFKQIRAPSNIAAWSFEMGSFSQKDRDTAISNLKNYLTSNKNIPARAISRDSILVIWRGFYAAMMQQDRPLLQEDLADRISSFVHIYSKERSSNRFIQVAMETFAREWHNGTQHLVDKRMMFFRRVIRQALFRLADQKWRGAASFMTMMEETIIRPADHDNVFPIGPKYHLSHLFMEELAKASNEHLTHKVILIFLRPYIKVMTVSTQNRYLEDVKANVFEQLLRQSDIGIDNRADLMDNEIVVDKNKKKVTPDQMVEDDDEEQQLSSEDSESDQDEEEAELDSDEEMQSDEELGSDEEHGDDDTEEDEMEEDEDSEEEDEFPLDPRAGSIDVVLPQLEVDYGDIGNSLYEIMSTRGIRSKNRNKLRHLVKKFHDISGGVYTLNRHPTLQPVHEILQEDIAEVDFDKAVEKGQRFIESEIASKRKNKDGSMKDEEHNSFRRTKTLMAIERAEKFKALQHKRELYEKKKVEKSFGRMAKRTMKMKERLDKRRMKAKGLLPTKKQKVLIDLDRIVQRQELMINRVLQVTDDSAMSGTNSKKSLNEKLPKKSTPAVETTSATTEKGPKGKKINSTNSPKQNSATRKKKENSSVEATKKIKNKKLKKTNNDFIVSDITAESTSTIISPKKNDLIAKVLLKRIALDSPKIKIVSAETKKAILNLPQGKGAASDNTKSPSPDKKRKAFCAVTPNNKQTKKLKLSTPSNIKINLKENTQHEFNDYKRSILASPAIPFQPSRTPLSSALKATSSPILVKKPFSRTLRNIPTNAKSERLKSPEAVGKVKKQAKKVKVSPLVLKGLRKRGLLEESFLADKVKVTTPNVSSISMKEKSVTSPKTTPAKPVAKKLTTPAKPVAKKLTTPAKPVAKKLTTPAKPVAKKLTTPAKPVGKKLTTPAKPVGKKLTPANPVGKKLALKQRAVASDFF